MNSKSPSRVHDIHCENVHIEIMGTNIYRIVSFHFGGVFGRRPPILIAPDFGQNELGFRTRKVCVFFQEFQRRIDARILRCTLFASFPNALVGELRERFLETLFLKIVCRSEYTRQMFEIGKKIGKQTTTVVLRN